MSFPPNPQFAIAELRANVPAFIEYLVPDFGEDESVVSTKEYLALVGPVVRRD